MNRFFSKKYLIRAVIGAVIAFIVSLPILGAHIGQSASGLSLKAQLNNSGLFAIIIFAILLFAPITEKFKTPTIPKPNISENLGIALLIIIGLILPFYVGRSALNVATLCLIYVLLGLGLNIVVGYAGLLNLGYAGFYAIGSYTYAILQQYGFGFWTTLPIAALISAVVGILLAFPILRLRGDYLAIVTLGFGEIIRLLINNLEFLTKGPKGINNIAAPTLFNFSFTKKTPEGLTSFHQWTGIKFNSEHQLILNYFIIFSLCLLALWAIKRLIRMPIGRAWEALREDEIACRSLGINPAKVKLSAFAVGALFAGITGAFFAARQGSVTPDSFTFAESALILAIVVLGGSQLGVILAAIAITALPELARGFSEYRMLIFGAIMVLMMLWRPQGLIPMKRPKMELPQ